MHTLIIGMTESGKSCLGRIMASQLRKAGKKVAVCEPLSESWDVDFHTDDINELQAYLQKNRSVYVFVDECGQYFDEGFNTDHNWLATRSRHYGHSVTFLAQRYTQIPKTMRDQCARGFIFTSSAKDGELLSDEWNKPILKTVNQLPQFHFYNVSRYNHCEKMVVVDYSKVEKSKDGNKPDDISGNVAGDSKSPAKRSKVGKGKGNER